MEQTITPERQESPVTSVRRGGAASIDQPAKEPLSDQRKTTPATSAGNESDPALAAFSREIDPVRINVEIFRRLRACFGLEAQDIRLSLPMVFNERRFEILRFEGEEISDLTDLRDEWFYGFYLSHVNERKAVLVYACNGTHVEWGPDRCVLQRLKTEPEEYPASALLGVAQDSNNEFVFVVQRAFKEWIKSREKHCVDVTVYFLTAAEFAARAKEFKWIWPEQPPSGQIREEGHS